MKSQTKKKTSQQSATDLIVLAADKNTASAIGGVLERPHSLGIRAIRHEIHVHPEKDPGCLTRSAEILSLYLKSCEHALVVFDRDGCGREKKSREELEQIVQQNLTKTGWQDRAEVIVIDPELENWVWSDSPHVATELGWKEQPIVLRAWLLQNDFLDDEKQHKPKKPKEAMEAVLRKMKKPRSSAIYHAIAAKVSFERCQDPSFLKLKTTLQSWFGECP